MTPHEVARIYDAHRVGDGQWRAKCPSHDGKSDNSLSINGASDGKTLLRCFAGCSTENVLASAGLGWSDLFAHSSLSPSSLSHPHRRIDPKVALQRRAEIGLRDWKEREGRIIRRRIWIRHRLVTEGERLIGKGRRSRGWGFLALGYQGLARLEWLVDLFDSHQPSDWLTARRFLKG